MLSTLNIILLSSIIISSFCIHILPTTLCSSLNSPSSSPLPFLQLLLNNFLSSTLSHLLSIVVIFVYVSGQSKISNLDNPRARVSGGDETVPCGQIPVNIMHLLQIDTTPCHVQTHGNKVSQGQYAVSLWWTCVCQPFVFVFKNYTPLMIITPINSYRNSRLNIS